MIGAPVATARADLGRQLAAWLTAVLAGAPGFPCGGLVANAAGVSVTPRWSDERLTLVVIVCRAEVGRVIGPGGSTLDSLSQLARCVGARLGLRVVGVEVIET